ncbi:NB-ARC and TPR domain protein [Cordyceps militaris CM01]|uniref:NB-ARC and TPR domain protein n=1 Tax=Cordyceps militaris (strain CM01) TaxID=983644 RepID=G3JBX3_CORMM|nr:NB-ARC and TPR domain protein [Cordyceps militaris CM01]EGX95344.1 NB-ARC and TPR domain protein [Cordyceps militaris CM01]
MAGRRFGSSRDGGIIIASLVTAEASILIKAAKMGPAGWDGRIMASTVSSTPNGQGQNKMLQAFYPLDNLGSPGREINVVVVPGLGTRPPSEWKDETGPWLEKLVDDCAGRAQIWIYESTHSSRNGPVVQQLADHGRRRKPLLFICHSLGGIILKWVRSPHHPNSRPRKERALTRDKALSLTKGHVFRHLDVVEVISGIVFLGTPHLPSTIAASPNLVESILKLHQRGTLRKDAVTADDNSLLARCCYDFELLGIQVPIVSAYETVESRVRFGMFKVVPTLILSKERSVIGSQQEVVIAASQDHEHICNVPVQSSLYEAIKNAWQRALDDAKFYTSTRDGGEMDTLRSLSTDNGQNQVQLIPTISSTREATYGSSTNPNQRADKAITSFEVVKKNPTLPCFSMQVHKRNSEFFGRQDIFDLIDETLLPDKQEVIDAGPFSVRSFALCGMGGIGKTEIAVEYAYARQSKYDAIFFVTADGKTILSEQFARIATVLNIEDQSNTKDLTVSCEIVKGWLSNPVRSYDIAVSAENEASWLLIFDNADDPSVLEDFWPSTGSGSVLITSRDSVAKNQIFTANKGIDLEPFSPPDAVRFLDTLAQKIPNAGQIEDAAQVADRLGGLPLLITQMAGVMARLRLSYSDCLSLLDNSGIEQIGSTGLAMSTPEQVYSVSSKLGFDSLAPSSLGLLSLISMLDPDRIPEVIVKSACSNASLEDFPQCLAAYFQARAQLLQTSLINQNPETGDIWVHRIVQDVARAKLEPHRLIKVYNVAIQAASSVWPFTNLENRFTTARYKFCAPLFPSIVRLRNAYKFISSLETFHHELPAAKLFGDTGWYRFERGFQEESKEWFALVHIICCGLDNRASEEALYMIRDTHHNLGTAAGETNDVKSFLQHVAVWLEMLEERKTSDGDIIVDYELAIGYNETGVAHAMDGQYEVALNYFSKAIETYQALPHYVETMLGWSASNVGLMHWVMGNYDDAERVLLEIIQIFASHNGVDDTLSFKTGKMLYALGNVYVSQGKLQQGLELHNRCLRQYRATLGDSHHRIGDICHRLSDDNIYFGNYAEAQVLINQALEVFGGRRQYQQELARSTYKASQVSRAMGNNDKAEEQLQEACQLRRALIPGDRRGNDELNEADFDSLVVFWSR